MRTLSRTAFESAKKESAKVTKRIITSGLDHWTVSISRLNTKYNRYLNNELGLNTNDGIASWYKKN